VGVSRTEKRDEDICDGILMVELGDLHLGSEYMGKDHHLELTRKALPRVERLELFGGHVLFLGVDRL
jgi:hypothetical protein